MKTKFFFVYLIIIVTCSCSVTKKIDALKPEPDNNSPLAFQTSTSFINVPVTINIADIENQLNKALSGLIYEDNNIEDDNIMMKVYKVAPIKLTEQKGKLQSVIPLKVNAVIKYGTTALGMNLYDTRDVNLNGIITLNSAIGLNNWKITSTTYLQPIEWKESPDVTIAGKKIAITYLINPAVKIFRTKIEKIIDESLSKATDFKPYVLEALQTASTPIEISPEYETWFKINPLELYVSDAILSKKQITMDMGLKCTMQTIVGQKPKNNFSKEKIVLKPVSKMPNRLNATVAAVSTYESASKIITKNFQGQEFTSGKRKVKVEKVNLWNKDEKVIIALNVSGSINGTIYLSGNPKYDNSNKEIFFENIDYVLETKNVLHKTANWLAEGYILKKIQENCKYSIKENMEEARKNIMPYLNNYSPIQGIFINGNLSEFEFDKLELSNNAIIAFIKISGNMNLKIDGIN